MLMNVPGAASSSQTVSGRGTSLRTTIAQAVNVAATHTAYETRYGSSASGSATSWNIGG